MPVRSTQIEVLGAGAAGQSIGEVQAVEQKPGRGSSTMLWISMQCPLEQALLQAQDPNKGMFAPSWQPSLGAPVPPAPADVLEPDAVDPNVVSVGAVLDELDMPVPSELVLLEDPVPVVPMPPVPSAGPDIVPAPEVRSCGTITGGSPAVLSSRSESPQEAYVKKIAMTVR